MSLSSNELLDYPVDAGSLFELVLAMLGMGTIRMLEKMAGRAK
jgi:hypothetical protein